MMRRAVPSVLLLCTGVAAQAFFRPLERNHFEPDPGSVEALVVIDVDHDGGVDLLIRTTAGAQSWYRNDGHGAFLLQPTLVLAADLRAAQSSGDVDGDGRADLLSAGVLHRNLGGGVFQASASALPATAMGIGSPLLIDLDGDGDRDVLALPPAVGPQHLCVFLNDGTGHFTDVSAGAIPAPAARPVTFVATDADRDGDIDLVAVFAGLGASLLRNDGRAHFSATAVPAIPPGATDLSAGDLDQDGDDDLLASGQMLRNDGLGGFTPLLANAWVSPLQPPVAFRQAALVDCDGDGRADLADPARNGWFHNEGSLGSPMAIDFYLVWHPPFAWGIGRLQYIDLDGDLDLDAIAPGARPRVLFNSNGEFHDAVQELVMEAPGPVTPLRAVDLRVVTGPVPFTEVAWIDNGTAVLLSGRRPPILPGYPGAYGRLYMPQVQRCTSVALCDLDGRGDYSLLACTAQGARLLLRAGFDALIDQSSLLNLLGQPVSVACGNLSGSPVDEIVFGATGIVGPQILSLVSNGQLQATVPVLPPPGAPNHPLAEEVRLADFDGDGDLDILHELRIVRNDGGGAWSAGPDFSAAVPPDAIGLCVLDFDGDGMADVLTWSTGTPVRLLHNLGNSFADVAATHLPTIGLPDWISVGDADGDGDPDLLATSQGRASLLRNDGPVFTRFADVGPGGVLVDMDQDLDADLFTGARIHHNRHNHLHAPRLPTLGADYRLEVHSWREGSPAGLAIVALATRSGYLTSPLLGIVRIDLASAIAVAIPLQNGTAALPMPMPRSPVLLGAEFLCQALLLDGGARGQCTNVLRETVR